MRKNSTLERQVKSLEINRKSQRSSEEKNSREEKINKDKKIINLEALIRQKENEIKFMKIKYDNVVEEKVELENEI